MKLPPSYSISQSYARLSLVFGPLALLCWVGCLISATGVPLPEQVGVLFFLLSGVCSLLGLGFSIFSRRERRMQRGRQSPSISISVLCSITALFLWLIFLITIITNIGI